MLFQLYIRFELCMYFSEHEGPVLDVGILHNGHSILITISFYIDYP